MSFKFPKASLLTSEIFSKDWLPKFIGVSTSSYSSDLLNSIGVTSLSSSNDKSEFDGANGIIGVRS